MYGSTGATHYHFVVSILMENKKAPGRLRCLSFISFSNYVSCQNGRLCENTLGESVPEWVLCFCILLLFEHIYGFLG